MTEILFGRFMLTVCCCPIISADICWQNMNVMQI